MALDFAGGSTVSHGMRSHAGLATQPYAGTRTQPSIRRRAERLIITLVTAHWPALSRAPRRRRSARPRDGRTHPAVGAHRGEAAHHRARDRRRRRDGDRAGAGHRVVQHAHREDARQEVDRPRFDLLAVRRGVAGGPGDERELGRVLARRRRLLRPSSPGPSRRRRARAPLRRARGSSASPLMSPAARCPLRPSRAASTKIVGLPALISVASIAPTPGTSSGSIRLPVGNIAPASRRPRLRRRPDRGTRASPRPPGRPRRRARSRPARRTSPSFIGTWLTMRFADVGLPDANDGVAVAPAPSPALG